MADDEIRAMADAWLARDNFIRAGLGTRSGEQIIGAVDRLEAAVDEIRGFVI
jgi:hypothetical protein